MPSRRHLAICAFLFVAAAAAPASPAFARGPRVTVAVFGVSVVEGRTLADPRRQSLSAQLESVLAARPELTRGGDGLLAASNLFWRFSHAVEAPRRPAAGGW